MTIAGDALLERSAELEALHAAARDAAAGSGRVVVVEGHSGIGKTALLDAARGVAGGAGMACLTARGGELERDLGFGVVRQLFGDVMRDAGAADLFAGPARLAAPLLGIELGGPGPPAPGDAAAASLHGLHWLVVNLAKRRPHALLVDDLQWCDPASARFLAFLARRIEGLPVLLAVSSRPAAGDAAPLDGLVRVAGATLLSPAPLSPAGTLAVVRSLAPEAEAATCAAAHELTGGNPFFVTAVARELAAGAPLDGAIGDWSPGHVTRAVRSRLRDATPAARALARAAAALGADAELRHAAALCELPVEQAAVAADELRALGLLAPDRRLDFLHPILRAAVYDDVPASARAAAHGRAARLLAEEGASAERIAVQVLGAERAGDPWRCEQLVRAARESVGRGAPEAAAAYLRRALDEPPPPDATPGLLFELGAAETLAFDVPAAIEHLRRSASTTRDPRQRLDAAVMLTLVEYLGGRGETGVHVLRELLADTRGDGALAAEVEGSIAILGGLRASTRPLVASLVEGMRGRVDGEGSASPSAIVAVALELVLAGRERDRAVALARRAIAGLGPSTSLLRDFELHTAIRCLMAADHLDEARALLDAELDGARTRGSQIIYVVWASLKSSVSFRMGAVHDAEADARAAYDYVRETGSPTGLPAAASYLVDALIERGELDEATRILASGPLAQPPSALPDVIPVNLLIHSRARLHLARGETAAAADDLRELGARQEAIGELNPALLPWRSTAALAAHKLRDERRARELAEEEHDLARAFGAPRAIGIALRTRALLERSEELMREAVEVLAASPARLEHARALAGLGEVALAARRPDEARPPLLEALELAHACGASALEARVLDALHATGARPRRPMLSGPGALTPSERRVAAMAARGLSNREVAEALFVTVRTVESHLSTAYRKLGIASRRELAEALAERPG